ncbi:hypothetical protein TIFTF001_041178 [Ficus carica]|uniref:Uncharacterized protein n=1 Tax=Ficus carica TaxID=3494 RepID=A0AA87ZL25_FICCA|nr:hypothetical protein TIFTF001_041178 [Ficus carica]
MPSLLFPTRLHNVSALYVIGATLFFKNGQDSTRSVVSESGSVPESSIDPLEFGVSDFEELMSEGRPKKSIL